MKAAIYFQHYKDYFWQYEATEKVISIPNSYTIAYWDFLVEVLDKLASQGLPRLGTLLLAMAATNSKGAEALSTIRYDYTAYNYSATQKEYDDAFAFLKMLSTIPEKYKKGANRVLVFQTLFLDSHQLVSSVKSEKIMADYHSEKFIPFSSAPIKFKENKIVAAALRPYKKDVSYKDIKPFYLLSQKFKTVEAIIATIGALPPIEEELIEQIPPTSEPSPTETDLIQELMENPMTYRTGNLISYIMGSIGLLLKNTQASQQPLGGVMDISNKGNLDQLLLTEFANDDLVFMSRLANNEALYINREKAKAANDRNKIILIDVSLKNWGTIKTLAFAVAVAISQHPKNKSSCTVFLLGNEAKLVKIDTIDGVIAALQLLAANLDAAIGLEAFLQKNNRQKSEVFFIGNKEAYQSTSILQTVQKYNHPIDFWIHPTTLGELALYKKASGGSKKHIQSFVVPIEELWANKKLQKKKEIEHSPQHYDSYPILLAHPLRFKSLLNYNNKHIYAISKEKVLLRFYDSEQNISSKGWELVKKHITLSNQHIALGENREGEAIILSYNASRKELDLYNIVTKKTIIKLFDEWKSSLYPKFFFHDKAFRYLSNSANFEISTEGKITKTEGRPVGLTDAYKNAMKEVEKLQRDINRCHFQMLKNIYTVSINENNNLVFNTHQFYLNSGNVIKIDTSKLAIKIKANKQDKSFVFEDGSSVEIDRSGMFILESSNPDIETIYVPAILDRALGIGTENEFAGNSYYYKNGACHLKITDMNNALKLQLIKDVKVELGLSLKESKELIDSSTTPLVKNIAIQKAENLKKALEKSGASAKIIKLEEGDLEIISTASFFAKHVNKFIAHIIQNV